MNISKIIIGKQQFIFQCEISELTNNSFLFMNLSQCQDNQKYTHTQDNKKYIHLLHDKHVHLNIFKYVWGQLNNIDNGSPIINGLNLADIFECLYYYDYFLTTDAFLERYEEMIHDNILILIRGNLHDPGLERMLRCIKNPHWKQCINNICVSEKRCSSKKNSKLAKISRFILKIK